jgi:hypothetical protein
LDNRAGAQFIDMTRFAVVEISARQCRGRMRRLYFLVPDTQIGKKVADELLLVHVEWQHIHVIAKRGTRLKAFEQTIERGELLVIADVPHGEVGQRSLNRDCPHLSAS